MMGTARTAMIVKWTLHSRSPLLWMSCAAVFAASAVEYHSDIRGSTSLLASISLVAGSTSYFTVIMPPLVAACLMYRERENELARELHLSGISPVTWRTLDTVLTTAVTGLLTISATFAAQACDWIHPTVAPSTLVSGPGNPVLLWVFMLVVLSVFSCAVMTRQPASSILLCGIFIPVVHIALLFLPVRFAILANLYPSVAARTLGLGVGTRSHLEGVVALGAVISWLLWSIARLHVPFSEPVQRYARTNHALAALNIKTVVAASCGLAVVGGALLPTFLSSVLPWNYRPSYVLQSVTDQGPKASAEQFFDAVWSGRTQVAERLATAPDVVPTVKRGDRRLLLRPLSSSFAVTDMVTLDQAQVQLDAGGTSLSVCMDRVDGSWLVGALSETGVC